MKIIIIGGVAAGMSAASKIARIDKTAEIIVYEKGGFLSYGACGLPYYVGDFNDDYRRMIARTKQQFEKVGINCHLFHEIIGVDFENKIIKVKNLKQDIEFIEGYDKLMISVGAAALMPNWKGTHLLGVHCLKTMEDGIFLREYAKSEKVKKVTIVGGGYIGVECAEALLHLGKEVRMIEATNRILTTFDEEMSNLGKEELEKKGVKICLNEKVELFKGDMYVKSIVTNQGSYETDLVIVAIGIRPATDFLKDTALDMSEQGAIIVNRYGESSVKDVYAAGDCALVYNKCVNENTFLPLGTVANKCGRIVGGNIVGETKMYIGALGSAAIKVCDIEMARTGIGEIEAKKRGLDYKTIFIHSYDHPAYYPNQTPIYIKLIYEEKTKKIMGAQTCGVKGAVLRIDVFAVAIQAGMTTEELGMTDLIYAPPFAGVWDVIQIACNAAK